MLVFDPTGQWLVTASEDQTAFLWNVTDGVPDAPSHVLRGHEGPITSVSITGDGHWLITGSTDRVARIWDLESNNPGHSPLVLAGHQAALTAVAFDPLNRWAATASADKSARIWDLRIDQLLDRGRRAVGRNLTREEWEQYFANRPYCPTFPELPVPANAEVSAQCAGLQVAGPWTKLIGLLSPR